MKGFPMGGVCLSALMVTSSRLCKYAEGAGFPFQIKSLEDGVDDSVHGLDVDKADHRPCSSPDFDETSFDRDIYLTPPGPTGCGLTNLANGTGSVCMAC